MADDMNNLAYLKHLRGPVMVSLDITSKCNLKCVHCYNNSDSVGADDEMSDAEILGVARQIAAFKPHNVCLCGGETLCRKNILEIVKALNGHVGSISLVSNGVLMTEDKVKGFVRNGVGQIQISLDGADAFSHDTFRGVPGSFEKAVAAINLLRENHVPQVATAFVPNKLNFMDVGDYCDLCHSLGVHIIRMMPFIPLGRGKLLGRDLILSDGEYFQFQRELVRAMEKYQGILTIDWVDPLAHLRRMPYNAFKGGKTYDLQIRSNGDLMATTYLPIVLGNCRRHSLQEYWDNGYDTLWKHPEVIRHTEKIQNIFDFETFEPAPYSGDNIYIDLI
ncbi:MAG: radical SAM protein [Turicibacter sp.]|nr:radical SAM protein [Turicibacter sp.]